MENLNMGSTSYRGNFNVQYRKNFV